tara:strand:- start:9710 stop:9886 length:177 start_codon:yes stop_codon:yes gene_type:complete
MQALMADSFIERCNNDAMQIAGAEDCKEGKEPVSDHSSYLEGYSKQYEIEQIEGANNG